MAGTLWETGIHTRLDLASGHCIMDITIDVKHQVMARRQLVRDDPRIRAMLDDVTTRCSTRPQFTHALSRDAAQEAIGAILRAYGSRPTDTSVVYAYDALYRALGIDWSKSKIVFLLRDIASDDD